MVRGRKNPLHLGFARRLRRARKVADLSHAALARAAGLASRTTTATLETGDTVPKVETVAKLAQALGVSACWLAFGIEMKTSGPGCAGLGERLREVRETRGLSMQSVELAAEVAANSVRNTEAGHSQPRLDTVEKLAKALGVSPCWLAYGLGSREVPARSQQRRVGASTAVPVE